MMDLHAPSSTYQRTGPPGLLRTDASLSSSLRRSTPVDTRSPQFEETDALAHDLETLDGGGGGGGGIGPSTLSTVSSIIRGMGRSVVPADVYGVPVKRHQEDEFNMLFAATDASDGAGLAHYVTSARGDVPTAQPASARAVVRGSRVVSLLRRHEDPVRVELQLSSNFLAPPAEDGARKPWRGSVLPDPSLVPAPRVVVPANNPSTTPPLLKPDFAEFDLHQLGEDGVPGSSGGGSGSSSRSVAGAQSGRAMVLRDQPRYVPLPIRTTMDDDVHWTPPTDEADALLVERKVFHMTEANVGERPVPPPTSTRNVAELYRVRQRLVAYDESEAFGFRARPLHGTEFIDELRQELREQATGSPKAQPKASVVSVRHGTSCYVVSADRTKMLVFNPCAGLETGPTLGKWEKVELVDGSLFRGGVTAYPPVDASLVPVPNVPFLVAASTSTLHVLSLQDGVWWVACLSGLESLRSIGWAHLVDHCTLYVRDRQRKEHGVIPLQEALEEVARIRRFPHDVSEEGPSFFVESRLQLIACTKHRLPPTSEPLIAVDGVPGVALHSVADAHIPHAWIYIYHSTAKNFIPWKRIDNGTVFFVAMSNHLVANATTVLFFSEEVHRLDVGGAASVSAARESLFRPKDGAAGSKTSRSGGSGSGQLTQRVLRVRQRLIVRNPPDGAAVQQSLSSPPKRQPDGQRHKTHDASETTDETSRRWRSESSVIRWVPLGACTSDFEERLRLEEIDGSKIDVIVKARRSEVHTVIPMHDRCCAVVSYDCKAYVVVELDRRTWMNRVLGNDAEETVDVV